MPENARMRGKNGWIRVRPTRMRWSSGTPPRSMRQAVRPLKSCHAVTFGNAMFRFPARCHSERSSSSIRLGGSLLTARGYGCFLSKHRATSDGWQPPGSSSSQNQAMSEIRSENHSRASARTRTSSQSMSFISFAAKERRERKERLCFLNPTVASFKYLCVPCVLLRLKISNS